MILLKYSSQKHPKIPQRGPKTQSCILSEALDPTQMPIPYKGNVDLMKKPSNALSLRSPSQVKVQRIPVEVTPSSHRAPSLEQPDFTYCWAA